MAMNTMIGTIPQNPMYMRQYQNPYFAQQMQIAANDRELNHEIDRLQEALLNNRSIRIDRLYNNLKANVQKSQYYNSFKDENGNIDDKKLRLALIELYNIRAMNTTGKMLEETIEDNQKNNFWSGYWNCIIPGFQDKSQSEVRRIFYNEEFSHSAGDKAANVTGSVAGIATYAGIGYLLGAGAIGALKGGAAMSWSGPGAIAGAIIGAAAGLVCGLISWLNK